MRIFLIYYILLIFSGVFLISKEIQETNNDFSYGINAGMIYGGPIPEKFLDNLEVTPLISFRGGLYSSYYLGNKFSIHSELSVSIKGVDFTTHYSRDTIVETIVDGQTGTIPTFYTANIKGDMGILYLDIPVLLQYDLTKNISIIGGFQPSLVIGGKNDVDVRIKVAEGFQKDLKRFYDNNHFLNSFDFALCVGGKYNFSDNLSLGFWGSRSITSLYKDSFKTDPAIDVGKMYHTQFQLALYYKL